MLGSRIQVEESQEFPRISKNFQQYLDVWYLICGNSTFSNFLIFTSVVLITGGQGGEISAEVYHPDRDSACVLPDLPDQRWGHTQDGDMLCGGWATPRSCRRWNPKTGTWDLETRELIEDRANHISWTPVDGSWLTYLMGGYSYKTYEILTGYEDGIHASFLPQHRTE